MLCTNCKKLLFKYTIKNCLRCQISVNNTLYSICENCSLSAKQCAACLKKMQNTTTTKHYFSGCGACKR
jgi:hypothetical protein